MAGPEVTFDEVAAAALSLQDDGDPITIEAVRELLELDTGSVNAIHQYLTAWRAEHIKPPVPPKPEIPPSLAAAVGNWAQQFAEEAGAGVRETLAQSESDMEALLRSGQQLEEERDELLAQLASSHAMVEEQGERIERLKAELRDARQVATDALVGKAKDQLAIEGKDSQLADLRAQLERNVATSAAVSDARLAAEMELVGATTARDNFEADLRDLRAQLDTCQAERTALRAELEALRASR